MLFSKFLMQFAKIGSFKWDFPAVSVKLLTHNRIGFMFWLFLNELPLIDTSLFFERQHTTAVLFSFMCIHWAIHDPVV